MAAIGAAIVTAWAAITTTVAAVASTVAAYAATAGVAGTLSAISTAASVVAIATALMMKPPSLASEGQQVNLQLAGPNFPLMAIYGRTGVQGVIVYRDCYASDNRALLVEQILSVGPIDAVESFSVMGRALTYSGNPSSGFATVTQVEGVDMRKSKLFRESGLKVHHRVGAINDYATLASMTGESPPYVTVGDSNPGLARTILRCYLDEKRLNFPDGYPDDPISVARGLKCWDPRKDSTYPGGSGPQRRAEASTHVWSENPIICALNHALGYWTTIPTKYWGMGVPVELIDLPGFVEAANICDANQWTVGGQVSAADGEWPIMVNLLAAGGAIPNDRGGLLSCYIRSPKVPTFSIQAHEVLGDRSVTTATRLSNRFNTVIPSYRDRNSKWEMVSGEPVFQQSWLDQDQGFRVTETLSLPLVNSAKQAHQLAAYFACDSREFIETELKCKPRALGVEIGECIEVALPELADGQTFIVMDKKWDAQAKVITLFLKSETFAKHAFCLGQSQVAPTPPSLITFDPTNPAGPGVNDWAIVSNSITQVVDGRPMVVVPALVVAGEVRDPMVQKVVVEVRPSGLTPQDRWPGGIPSNLDAEDIAIEMDEFGWVTGAEASRTATEITVAPLQSQTSYDASIRYEMINGAFSERRILTNTTTARDMAGGMAPGGIDWSDNGNPDAPIVNVPPALDVDQNGQLQPGNVASGVPGFTSLAAFNVAQKIFNEKLAEDQADADQKITDGLAAEADARAALKTALEDADHTITTNFNGLKNEVVGARGTSTTLAGRLTTLANDINGKVSASEIDALETEIADARGSFGSVASRLTKAETDISGKSDASRVTLLEARSKVVPNLIANGGFTMPLANTWFLEGGAGPEIRYDGQVGSYLHSDGPYVVSEQYPFSPGYIASVSWSGLAANPDAHVYLQAIPSYQKLAHAAYKPGGWDQRHVSDGTSVAAPAGTTHLRAVIHTQNAALDVSRIKVNFGATATDWTDDQTDRLVVSKIATVETANANGASRITELEATSDDEYLTQNTGFTLYTNAAQTGFTTPDKWYPWGEKVNDSHRVPGHLGRYGWRSHNNAGGAIGSGDVGITQDFNNNPRLANLSPGYYVLEADIYFGAGEIGGAGVFWYFQNGDDHARINFATDKTVDGDVVGVQGASGRSYSWRKLVKINNVGSGNSVFHLMTEWDGFDGSNARPKVIEWQRCGLRKATAQEVAAERADTNASNAQAKLVQVEQVQNEIVGRGGGGGNLVGNTSLESMTGWTPLNYFGDPSVLDTSMLGINYPRDDNWHPAQDNCLSMFVKAPTTVYADWYSDEFPLVPGKTYEFGMSAAVHRTYAECYLEVRLADGSQATYPWASVDGDRYMYENYSGGRDLRSYGQFWEKYTVPTNAAWTRGRLILRRGPTASGQVDSWSWFTRPFVREIPVGQTKPSPWDYGAQRWLSRARWSVQPAVNGASGFITAEAVNSGGVATSNVSIGAQSIQMYNQNGQDWKLAMQVQGGNAVFTGNLQASRILLGNGAGWDIQKAQKVFSVTDGQVISFGTDLGAIPSISFERDGLAPLNAGETYDIKAVNLSATGFQLSAKINIPAAQSAQETPGPGYAETVGTGTGGRTLYLEGKPTSVNGSYRYRASGAQEHRLYGRHTGQIMFPDSDDLDYVTTTLGIWAWNGNWVKVATYYVDTVADPWQYPNGQMSTPMLGWTIDETFQLPSNVSYINVTRESSTNGRTGYINQVGPISWTAQGAGSGVRTATPNGGQTRVRVIPS